MDRNVDISSLPSHVLGVYSPSYCPIKSRTAVATVDFDGFSKVLTQRFKDLFTKCFQITHNLLGWCVVNLLSRCCGALYELRQHEMWGKTNIPAQLVAYNAQKYPGATIVDKR